MISIRQYIAFIFAVAAMPTLAADIVLTPPAGGGVSMTNAAGDATQLRVADDGTTVGGNVVLGTSTPTSGNVMKGASRFIHSFGMFNTFIGKDAGNFTMTGASNTASGASALTNNIGSDNTASGAGALFTNTSGNQNTASGSVALYGNTSGGSNTATGYQALYGNTNGSFNTAIGAGALLANTGGASNTASGYYALSTSTGSNNTASGAAALSSNTTGSQNTASGTVALLNNTTGMNNAAYGYLALYNNVAGQWNIAVGSGAGAALTTGSYNIDIGNSGVAGEGNTIRIGDANQAKAFIAGIRGVTTGTANAIAVMIDSNGQLGTVSSSRRLKDDIADMDSASSALMKLRPVTFHYKSDQDPAGRTLQYGLVAEEVAQVYPGLVAHSADGQVETVMYQFLPTMLLNEYQKQQRAIEAQATQVAQLEAGRREQMEALARQTKRISQLESERESRTAEIASLKAAVAGVAKLNGESARMAAILERLDRSTFVNSAAR